MLQHQNNNIIIYSMNAFEKQTLTLPHVSHHRNLQWILFISHLKHARIRTRTFSLTRCGKSVCNERQLTSFKFKEDTEMKEH